MADARLDLIIDAKNNLDRELKKARQEVKNTADSVKELGVALTAAFAAGGAAIVSFAKSAGRMEQSQIAFETMLGSAEAAQGLLEDLADFAKKTPFEFVGIQQTAKQLMAMGIETEKIIPTLKSLGDVSAGLSVPIEQVAYAYGQVRSANQLLGTELRQFVNAGVPLLAELAAMYGVTEAEVKKMVEQGKVGFADVEKAFQNMSSEGGKFFNLMDKQSESLLGMWSNLKDSTEQLKISIGNALLPALKSLVSIMLSVAEAVQKFVENNPGIAKLAGTLLIATTAMAGLGAAAIAAKLAFGGFKVALIQSVSLLPGMSMAIKAFSMGMAANVGIVNSLKVALMTLNPVMIALGLALAAVAIAWMKVKKEKQEALAMMDGIISKTEQEKDKYLENIEVLNGADRARAEMKNELYNKNLEIQRAIAEKEKLVLEKATKDEIEASQKVIDAKQREFDQIVAANKKKLAAIKDVDRSILVSADELSAAIVANGTEEIKNRVALIEQNKIVNENVQRGILAINGQVSAETVRLMQAQFNEQSALATEFKNHLISLFNKPIRQSIIIDTIRGEGAVAGMIGKAKEMVNTFVSGSKKIEASIKPIESAVGSIGSGTGKAADSFADFAKKVKSEADSIAGKIKSINKSIADLQKQTEESNKSNRESLASAYADAEQRARELKDERKRIESELRKDITADESERLREQLSEVQANLDKENDALAAAKAYQGEISAELAEARKLAQMSELERAIYAYEQEKVKIKEVFNEKMSLIQQERAAVLEQQRELQNMVEEKNQELKKLYRDDTAGFRSELDEQVKLLDQTAKDMIAMYNEISAARANALGTKAVKVQYSGKYSGNRATGGLVYPGNAYKVGERGAETFVPSTKGRIMPNTGGNNINVTIHVGGNVATERDLAESIMDVFTRELKLSSQIT